MPDPCRPSSQPSAYSCWKASVTTVRLTPSCAARDLLEGRRSPGLSSPSDIAPRSASDSCTVSGTALERSRRRGGSADGRDKVVFRFREEVAMFGESTSF
ncbi:hypothetical protein GCM10009602_17730 [Nocardiopsis tropica]